MVKLPYTIKALRLIRDTPEWQDQQMRARRWYDLNTERAKDQARASAARDPGRRRAVEQAYRDRHPERRRESIKRCRSRPGYRQAERSARRAGDIITPEARDYVTVLMGDPCGYCGAPAVQVDHITPVALGGDGSWENLTAACADCNRRKSAQSLLSYLVRLAPR